MIIKNILDIRSNRVDGDARIHSRAEQIKMPVFRSLIKAEHKKSALGLNLLNVFQVFNNIAQLI